MKMQCKLFHCSSGSIFWGHCPAVEDLFQLIFVGIYSILHDLSCFPLQLSSTSLWLGLLQQGRPRVWKLWHNLCDTQTMQLSWTWKQTCCQKSLQTARKNTNSWVYNWDQTSKSTPFPLWHFGHSVTPDVIWGHQSNMSRMYVALFRCLFEKYFWTPSFFFHFNTMHYVLSVQSLRTPISSIDIGHCHKTKSEKAQTVWKLYTVYTETHMRNTREF